MMKALLLNDVSYIKKSIKYHLILHLFILFIAFISVASKICVIYLKKNEGDVCLADCATTHNSSR